MMLVIFFLFNLITKNHNLLNIYFYFSNPEIYWGWLPSLFFLVWGKIGNFVDMIEINEECQTIHIVYYPFIFWRKKEITYFISDSNFAYNYYFSSRKVFWLKYIWITYVSSCICFYERKKMKLKFHDAIGWSRDQMKEICEELEKYKKPENI